MCGKIQSGQIWLSEWSLYKVVLKERKHTNNLELDYVRLKKGGGGFKFHWTIITSYMIVYEKLHVLNVQLLLAFM